MWQCFQPEMYHIHIHIPGFPMHCVTTMRFINQLILSHFLHLSISNDQMIDHGHQGWAESCAVACIMEGRMMVVLHAGWHYGLAVLCMTQPMTLLTKVLFVNSICNYILVFWVNNNGHDSVKFICHQSTCIRVWNYGMPHLTLAYAQMNYYASQCRHWKQVKADSDQNRYMNYLFLKIHRQI